MPVYGLVVTLGGEEAAREGVHAALRGDARFLLGGEEQGRLPLALSCEGLEEEEEALGWLEALEGVVFVDVVFVDFSDIEELEVLPRRRRGAGLDWRRER